MADEGRTSGEGRTSKVEQLQEQVNQRVRRAVEDLQRELRDRLRQAGDKIVGELESHLGDDTPSLPDSFLSSDELSPLAEEAAAAARAEASRASLGSLVSALASLDRAGRQSEVLEALLRETRRFADRAAVFLVRGDGLDLWGAEGWDGALDGTRVPFADEGPWSSEELASGAVELEPSYCGELCSAIDAALPGTAVLVPLFLRDKLSAVVYADHAEGGALSVEAIQGLTYVAALALESLPFRKRESTATLRLAGAGTSSAPVPEALAVPADEDGYDDGGGEDDGGEGELLSMDEVGGGGFDEAEDDAAEADDRSGLDDDFDSELEADLDGDDDLESDLDSQDDDLAGDLDDTFSAGEVTLDDEAPGGGDALTYDLDDDADLDETGLGAGADDTAGDDEDGDDEDGDDDEDWASRPEVVGFRVEDDEDDEPEAAAEEEADAGDDGAVSEMAPVSSPAETVYAPAPPLPSDTAEPEIPAPPAPDTAAESEVTPPPASEPAAGSSQVAPPADLDGPGRAFTQPKPETEEDARHDEARRLARLLVSEIRLYNEDEVDEGRRNRDIYQRLKEDIDRSRQMYEERVDPGVRDTSDYFYDELVRNLAGGDETALGL